MPDNEKKYRRIKSFVLRQGRLTPGQQHAFEKSWPVFGLEFNPEPLDFKSLFGNDHPVVLEIGFGNGDSLAQMAEDHPELNYLGVEVHRPGVGHLLIEIEKRQLNNLRIISHDAIEILQHMIPHAGLEGVQLFFPDPWHKKRHHKRRIVQTSFLDLLTKCVRPGGFFHAATDWENYAEHILEVIQAHPAFKNTSDSGFIERPDFRPQTKFETRGQNLGHGVWDLMAKRC